MFIISILIQSCRVGRQIVRVAKKSSTFNINLNIIIVIRHILEKQVGKETSRSSSFKTINYIIMIVHNLVKQGGKVGSYKKGTEIFTIIFNTIFT